MDTSNNLISGGAGGSTPMCSTCIHQIPDKHFSGWGWCGHKENLVITEDYPEGFTPSQSPSGTCSLHSEREKE